MTLNYAEAMLLWSTVAYTGKLVPTQDGEQPEYRSLNGEESSQRGHYKKRLVAIETELKEKITEARNEHSKKVDAARIALESIYKKNEDEKDEDYTNRINSLIDKDEELKKSLAVLNAVLKESNESEHEFDLTEKTLKVLKKYFVEFGDTVGFKSGDDESVISLTEKLEPIQLV